MITMGVVGLGKMGLSHLSIFRAHPDVDLVAVCDSTGYVLDVLSKYTGLRTYKDLSAMLAAEQLDAVVIATPSHLHAPMVRTALEAGVHVFCEKPFTLDDADGQALTALARERGLVTQVGYHNRFVAAFAELKRLIDAGALGEVTHVVAEAYGPVVLAPKGGTWRSRRSVRWRLPLRLRGPPDRPRAVVPRHADRRRGQSAQPDLLGRDRRRGGVAP